MHYQNEVTISLPRERVSELFQDPEFTRNWQPMLRELEPISGEPGAAGSVTHMHYDENGRVVTLQETIQSNNLPESFTAVYEAPNVYNRCVNHFYKVGDDQTRWVMENEFKFTGWMRIMAFFMRGAFPKRTQKDMQAFKMAAEARG
ncbi:MAG: SRPBCC family protein [Anaerolineae bacterium]|nr:SRPBCC family protein [Anaerolineae bacterium]